MLEKLKFKVRSFLGNVKVFSDLEHLENHINHLEEKIENHITHLEEKVEANQQYNMSLLYEVISRHNTSQELVNRSRPGTILDCWINEISLLMPIEVLKSYAHCLDPLSDKQLSFMVETHCSNWLADQLNEGDIFIDVGAAFGVISLPLSSLLGQKGKIYAFEPARRTVNFLEKIIAMNGVENIKIIPMAVSDQKGTAEFIEYSFDNSLSWVSDASTLANGAKPVQNNHFSYNVEITTIDDFVSTMAIKPGAIKIDIEGFEQYALEGAKKTLESYHPALCIDIHQDVKTQKSALLTVEPFLKALGYSCEYREHTLFAHHS